MDTPIELGVLDVLRASDVTRWQIVKTYRSQSVAEHTFEVATIALWLLERTRLTETISLSHYKAEILEWALCHDMAEVITGDFPSPVKHIGTIKEQLRDVEDKFTFCGKKLGGAGNSRVAFVIKTADLIADCCYLRRNANTKDMQVREVLMRLEQALESYNPAGYSAYTDALMSKPITMETLFDVES